MSQYDPAFARRASRFLDALERKGYRPKITSGHRSLAEQRLLVLSGRSWTVNSKHLQGRAIDISILGVVPDAVPKSVWMTVGKIGERYGLRWGGRWRVFDASHFEF
jgi:peptidoglycan L-alanyl-D-glutamate endopeptidase CwlK